MANELGENLRALRQERGLGVEDVAAHVGVSVATIYRYENGQIEDVPKKNLGRIAELYGVPVAELCGIGLSPTITLRVPKRVPPKPAARVGVVRINEEAELALHRLASAAGMSLSKVASELIVQAAKICVIEEEVNE